MGLGGADAQALTDNADNPEKVRQNIQLAAIIQPAYEQKPDKIRKLVDIQDVYKRQGVVLKNSA